MTTEPCSDCPPSTLDALVGDDERLKNALYGEEEDPLQPVSVVIPLKIEAAIDEHALESLVRQYLSIKDIPLSAQTQEELLDAIAEARDDLDRMVGSITDGIIAYIGQASPTAVVQWRISIEE